MDSTTANFMSGSLSHPGGPETPASKGAGECNSTGGRADSAVEGLRPPSGIETLQIGINLQPESGGIYRSVLNFREVFASNGWDNRILNFRTRPPSPGDARSAVPITDVTCAGWPVLRGYGWSSALYGDKVLGLIRGASAVIIHGLYFHASARLARCAQAHGIPVILVCHGGLDPFVFTYRRWRKSLWLRAFGRSLLNSSAAVVCSTTREREKALPFLRMAKTEVLHWPVPVPPEQKQAEANLEIRRRLSLKPESKILLFCGRLHEIKRPLETARAFLDAGLDDWSLLLVGPIDPSFDEKPLRRLCASAPGKCFLMGAQFETDIERCYLGANAFVSFSRKENFGYSVAEAAAHGLPVLVSEGVDLAPELAPSGAALVWREAPPDSMAAFLRDACAMPSNALADIGARGRKWVAKHLSRQHFHERLTAIILRAIAGRPAG